MCGRGFVYEYVGGIVGRVKFIHSNQSFVLVYKICFTCIYLSLDICVMQLIESVRERERERRGVARVVAVMVVGS